MLENIHINNPIAVNNKIHRNKAAYIMLYRSRSMCPVYCGFHWWKRQRAEHHARIRAYERAAEVQCHRNLLNLSPLSHFLWNFHLHKFSYFQVNLFSLCMSNRPKLCPSFPHLWQVNNRSSLMLPGSILETCTEQVYCSHLLRLHSTKPSLSHHWN